MTELRVLGIGSPFAGDQLGWEVVKQLQKNRQLNALPKSRLDLSCHDRPGFRLIELLQGAKTVFIIDAVQSGAPVATLHRFQNEAIEQLKSPTSSHAMGIAEGLQMAKALGCLTPDIRFYGIEVDEIQINFQLTDPLSKAITILATELAVDILKQLHFTA